MVKSLASPDDINRIGTILVSPDRPLKERFRALFTLRNLGGEDAIQWINKGFKDDSALLKHELAYCLGQMGDTSAIPMLVEVLKDTQQEAMVRHEAGEALGAIGSEEVLDMLDEYSKDPVVEVAETCQLAAQKIRWAKSPEKNLPENPYLSVDPTPPAPDSSVDQLKEILVDAKQSLFQRYRAMFTLRNKGGEDAVLALCEGFKDESSALFRHEIAYVLGQMQHPAAKEALSSVLADARENAMVRHEAAEALGAIATDTCMQTLKQFVEDPSRVVKESCVVALDMGDYEQSCQFQYADTLSQCQT